jgi:hypothetical protein
MNRNPAVGAAVAVEQADFQRLVVAVGGLHLDAVRIGPPVSAAVRGRRIPDHHPRRIGAAIADARVHLLAALEAFVDRAGHHHVVVDFRNGVLLEHVQPQVAAAVVEDGELEIAHAPVRRFGGEAVRIGAAVLLQNIDCVVAAQRAQGAAMDVGGRIDRAVGDPLAVGLPDLDGVVVVALEALVDARPAPPEHVDLRKDVQRAVLVEHQRLVGNQIGFHLDVDAFVGDLLRREKGVGLHHAGEPFIGLGAHRQEHAHEAVVGAALGRGARHQREIPLRHQRGILGVLVHAEDVRGDRPQAAAHHAVVVRHAEVAVAADFDQAGEIGLADSCWCRTGGRP